MADKVRNEPQRGHPNDPSNWAEEEVAGEHGTTAMPSSLADEAHPEVDPQTPGGAMRKVKEEAGEGEGLGEKAKRAVQELDRQISGEYERREDPAAAPRHGEPHPGVR
ncbi:MAG: hypothetical protein JOZ46_06410 [Candidatus Dormibacteraeota bacterium]|nr:hypothetical protein [Candidatus Dormibacteraeota bacterium]MBV9525431.1 hypothetical protein [Candidatus Dormibacteraeota bacterium]